MRFWHHDVKWNWRSESDQWGILKFNKWHFCFTFRFTVLPVHHKVTIWFDFNPHGFKPRNRELVLRTEINKPNLHLMSNNKNFRSYKQPENLHINKPSEGAQARSPRVIQGLDSSGNYQQVFVMINKWSVHGRNYTRNRRFFPLTSWCSSGVLAWCTLPWWEYSHLDRSWINTETKITLKIKR